MKLFFSYEVSVTVKVKFKIERKRAKGFKFFEINGNHI